MELVMVSALDNAIFHLPGLWIGVPDSILDVLIADPLANGVVGCQSLEVLVIILLCH